MNKFFKTLFGIALSAVIAVSAGVAVFNYSPTSVKAADTVSTADMASYVKTNDGYARIGTAKSIISPFSDYNHKGLVLSGSNGATFDLGVIDISKSHWTMPANDTTQGHSTIPESISPFVTWNYIVDSVTSTQADSAAYSKPQLHYLTFTLSDYNDPTNYFVAEWRYINDSGSVSSRAYASGQTVKDGYYRENQGWRGSYCTNDITIKAMCNLLGYSCSGASLGTKSIGSNVPFAMVYDTNKNCLYKTSGFGSGDLSRSHAIRDFDEEKYDTGTGVSGDTKWKGFSSKYVNVKVEFKTVSNNTQTSIVIRSLGGKDLTKETVTVEDNEYANVVNELNRETMAADNGKVTLYAPLKASAFNKKFIPNSVVKVMQGSEEVKSVTFTSETATCALSAGNYTLNFYDDAENLLGSKNVTVTTYNKLSTETLYNVTTNGNAEYGIHKLNRNGNTLVEGLRLTGGVGATFNLGTVDIGNAKWNGTETSMGSVAPINTMEFFFDTASEIVRPDTYQGIKFDIILSDVNNPTNTLTVRFLAEWSDSKAIGNKSVAYMQAAGSGQQFGAWRANKTTVVNQTPQANTLKAADAAVLGYAKKDYEMTIYGSEVPFSFCYDTEKNALYRTVVGNASTVLKNAYIVRNFETETYPAFDNNPAISTACDATWAGFSSTKVNVSVKFTEAADTSRDYAMVITKLGNSVLAEGATFETESIEPEVEKVIKANKQVKVNAPKVGHNLFSSYMPGSKLVISKDGEEFDTIDFTSIDADYTFEEVGAYVFNYYNANNELIYGPYNVTVQDKYIVNLTVNNASVYLGDEKVTDPSKLELDLDEVITFVPNPINYTNRKYSHVKTLNLNGKQYNFNTTAVENNSDLPLVKDGENYTLTITNDILNGSSVEMAVTFDEYCKITVEDKYASGGKLDYYAWATGKFDLASLSGAIMTYNAIRRGLSSDAILYGYARKDIGFNFDTKQEITKRDDDFTYNYKEVGLMFYTGRALGVTDGIIDKTKAYAIIPNMVFEALYLNVNVRNEIKIADDGKGGVNEQLSGFRFVVEIEKDSYDRVKYYTSIGTNSAINIDFHNYITTKADLEKVGRTSNYNAIGLSWRKSAWIEKPGTVNGLGLTMLSDGNTSISNEGKVAGYVYKHLNEVNGDFWLDSDKHKNSESHYAYAITLRNLTGKTAEREYVFATMLTGSYMAGGNTGLLNDVKAVKVSDVCEQLFANNLLAEAPATGTYYTMLVDGVEKYSKYTATHMKWVAEMGGLNYEISEIENA